MIGRIRGILLEKQLPDILIDVQGIAYELQVSMTSFFRLPEMGHEVMLHTHFIVREDAQLLYGFYDLAERTLFRQLIKVSGVGPKIALAILSSITTPEFISCVLNNDSKRLVQLPGVGKKMAERLIIEMRDRIKELAQAQSADMATPHVNTAPKTAQQDAVSALVALGYKPQEASRAIQSHAHDKDLPSEDLLRLALKNLAK
jgi:holliday junction DNA helicase RuvA